MRKTILRTMLMLLGGAAVMPTWADTEVVDGITWTYTISGGQAAVGYGGPSPAISCWTTGDIVIPDKLGSCPVTIIRNYAFYGCNYLASVSIPSNVTSIGSYAFQDCYRITNITIPASVTSIGYCAFSGCSGLGSGVVIRDGCVLTVNGDCPESVVIPNGTRIIAGGAFYRCSRMTHVTIPMSVTSIGNKAFYGCSGLGNGVVTIDGCVLTVDGYCPESVVIPNGTRIIADSVFSYCSGLTSVTIPSSVRIIGNKAFASCTGLTSMEIPNGVTSIGDGAFCGCTELTSLTIPSSLKSIGGDAFDECPKLTKVNVENGCKALVRGKNAIYNAQTGEKVWSQSLSAQVVSTSIRESDPTIMDVTYELTGTGYDTADVRVLMFRETAGSWATVIRPETFVDGTEKNIGDGMKVNVQHTISWRITADTKDTLAKYCAMIIVRPGELLPLKFATIPVGNGHPAYRVSTTTWISDSQIANALWWLYADHDEGLVLDGGVLKIDGEKVIQFEKQSFLVEYENRYSESTYRHLFAKMGYAMLTDMDTYNRINSIARLNLPALGLYETEKTVELSGIGTVVSMGQYVSRRYVIAYKELQ